MYFMRKRIFLLLASCVFILCACGERTNKTSVSSSDKPDSFSTSIAYTVPETEHIHIFTEVAPVAPTCTKDGATSKKVCTCGYTEGGDIVAALGHSYISYPAKAATPTQKGHTAYTKCAVCGDLQGYSETNYIYPCADLLPSVYDRISIFNLPETAKKEILGMYDAAMAFKETYTFQSSVTKAQMEQYYKILAFSLPETMMILSTYRCNQQGNRMTSITFDYVLTQPEYLDRMTALKKAVTPLLNAVQGKSDFEKVKYFQNHLIETCSYTLDADDVTNAYGALVNGINHCDGFSDAMNLLCNAAGVKCQTVLGYTSVYHAWNIVEIGKQYYYLDITTNNVDWYNKPLYAVFGASRNYIETIGYSIHQDYTSIVPAAPSELNISNRYMPSIKTGQDVQSAMTGIANEILQKTPVQIYIQCDGQAVFDSAKKYNNSIIANTIKKAYPEADVQILNKTTFKVICIVVTY